MKTNLFSKIKTFFQNQIAKVIPLMKKENLTTDSHRWTRIWNQEFFQTLRKGIVHGFGIMLGIFGTGLLLAVPSGVSSPWASGDKLTAAGLNALRTAIESIPNWTKNGTSAYYTDGNVGIGTSSPITKLDVKGVISLQDSSTKTFNAGIATESAAQLINIGINEGSGNRFGGTYNSANQGGMLRIEARNCCNLFTFLGREEGVSSGAGNELMVIKSNGNVGIGTSSPNKRLHVEGTGMQFGQTTPNILTAFDGTVFSYLESSIGYGGIRLRSNLDISLSPGDSEKFRITSAGNVGINTSSPSVSLHVAGNACTTGTGMTACASDKRLKENIKPIENALETILKLKPVHFTWNQLSEKEFGYKSGTQDIGVISQEIEKINPDWVKTVKSDYKMVKDSFTKWYTIKAIQELNEIVEKENSSLRSRYASLLDEHNSLKKEIEELSFRQSSMTEENKELKKQLTELKKENSENLISLEERIKTMEGLRYARK